MDKSWLAFTDWMSIQQHQSNKSLYAHKLLIYRLIHNSSWHFNTGSYRLNSNGITSSKQTIQCFEAVTWGATFSSWYWRDSVPLKPGKNFRIPSLFFN